MKHKERYVVLKRSDLQKYITRKFRLELQGVVETINQHREFFENKGPLKCVVVESDWPEYERVWNMLEARVNMENQTKAINLNDGVMIMARRIVQACIQDAHEEGYDIEAGMFGPHLSKELVEINEWRKKAELFDKLCELTGENKNA